MSTTAGDLLGTCTIAGLGETFSLYALATDGWSGQWPDNPGASRHSHLRAMDA